MEGVIVIFRDFIYPLVVGTAVIWAPLLVYWIAFPWWLEYVRKLKVADAKWTMVEIKIPREILKSPLAMETILTSLHADTKPPFFHPLGEQKKWYSIFVDFPKWYGAVWAGNWPLWRSLEIASIEGNIYFFIRCETKHREMVENLIYAQFPQAEVTEVEDYTRYVPPFHQGNGWELRGTDMRLKNPEILPIKTYIDYGLDDNQTEEEQKIDPIVPLLQVFGSLGAGEQAWMQIVIQGSWAHFDNPTKDPKKLAEKPFITWSDWGKAYIDEVVEKYSVQTERKKADEKAGTKAEYIMTGGYRNLPEYEKPKIEAIQRAISKPAYDCGIRILYIAKTEKFKKDKLGEFTGAFKQFNAPELNVFEAVNETDGGFDYPFQDYKDLKKIHNREKFFKRYIKRDFFYPPEMAATKIIKHLGEVPLTKGSLGPVSKFVLNTEELATIFHFPGSVAGTSGLGRIEAQKAEPPANLPF